VTGVYDQGTGGRLPEKVPGQHRWVAVTAFTLSGDEVREAMGGKDVLLDHENRIELSVGCYDCEQEFEEAAPECPFNVRSESQIGGDDPRPLNVESDPVGSKPGKPDDELLDKVVTLVDGIGTQAYLTVSAGEEAVVEPRLLLSLVGKVNKRDIAVHHAYMLTPEIVGLLQAQLVAGAFAMGDAGMQRVSAAFDERVNELSADEPGSAEQ
jgi:hypothetical protein